MVTFENFLHQNILMAWNIYFAVNVKLYSLFSDLVLLSLLIRILILKDVLYLFRGGVLLTVEGNNFDSVAKPLMRVRVKYNKTDEQLTYPLWTTPEVCSFTGLCWFILYYWLGFLSKLRESVPAVIPWYNILSAHFTMQFVAVHSTQCNCNGVSHPTPVQIFTTRI